MAENTRWEIIKFLKENGASSVKEIIDGLNRNSNNIRKCLSQHKGRSFCQVDRGIWDVIQNNGYKEALRFLNNLFNTNAKLIMSVPENREKVRENRELIMKIKEMVE